jgi:aromatic-amino-acid transaminase
MLAAFESLPSGSLVLLHACCHNPTGVDPTKEQWDTLAGVIARRGLFPFVDCAYQGFGESLADDAYAIRAIAATGIPMIVAASCSKNFGLYRDRIGSLSFVAPDEASLARITSQLKRIVRANYSSPPAQGALIVTEILTNASLRAQWEAELTEMRDRIKTQRKALTEALNAADLGQDFSFILSHRGMFTYTGFSEAVVDTLRTEHGVYLVRSGRMCVAALNSSNRDMVAQAIINTLKA